MKSASARTLVACAIALLAALALLLGAAPPALVPAGPLTSAREALLAGLAASPLRGLLGLPPRQPPFQLPSRRIRWVDPAQLVRHEYTSRPHLESLLVHLQSLEPSEPVPIPVVTASHPRVILDGHHRVAASRVLGLRRIPVWEVDDSDEVVHWDTTLVRCYSRSSGQRMPLSLVTERARNGSIDWGIKGTRHVALLQTLRPPPAAIEVELERVTPRVVWREWIAGSGVDGDEPAQPSHRAPARAHAAPGPSASRLQQQLVQVAA